MTKWSWFKVKWKYVKREGYKIIIKKVPTLKNKIGIWKKKKYNSDISKVVEFHNFFALEQFFLLSHTL